MTGEEAIKTLESAKHFAYDGIYEEAFDMAIKALEQKSTAKNDLAGNIMDFPKSFDDFVKDYGFKDKDEVYTNGSELIPVFRVKQWLEHISTTKNDLGVDCIDRAELLKAMDTWDKFGNVPNRGLIPLRTSALQGIYVTYVKYDDMVKCVKGMPSVTPQEPIHGKCNQCKHYEGVHNVQGHAPCSYHKIGGVMWNWYCSQFEVR